MAQKPKPQYKDLPLKSIQINPQVRTEFDPDALAELADSIRQVGVIQAITVRPVAGVAQPTNTPGYFSVDGQYELVAGERRYRAAQLAELDYIPCCIKHLTDEEVEDLQLTENLQRKDLTPMEEAASFKHMVERKAVPPVELAARLVKPLDYIQRRLALNNLVPKAQEYVRAKVLPLVVADLLAPLLPADQEKVLKDCMVHEYGPGDEARQIKRTYCKPVNKVRWFLTTNITRQLDKAPFSKTRKVEGVDAPACVVCPMRTSTRAELFADMLEGDRCLNGKCFSAKWEAHFDNIAGYLEKTHGHPITFVKASYSAAAPKRALEPYGVRLEQVGKVDPCTNLSDVCLLEKDQEPRMTRACLNASCACRNRVDQADVLGIQNARTYHYTAEQMILGRQRVLQHQREKIGPKILTATLAEHSPMECPMAVKLLIMVLADNMRDELVLQELAAMEKPMTGPDTGLEPDMIIKHLATFTDRERDHLVGALLLQLLRTRYDDEPYLQELAGEMLYPEDRVQVDATIAHQAEEATAGIFTRPSFQVGEDGQAHITIPDAYSVGLPAPDDLNVDPEPSAPVGVQEEEHVEYD